VFGSQGWNRDFSLEKCGGSTHIGRVSAFPQPSLDLFGPATPPGFRYAPESLSAAEEQRFVARFETLPFQPFIFHGHLGNRRVVSFGYRYDYAAQRLREAEPMPDFLAPLADAAARFSGIAASGFHQALITEYAPGAGIGWHRDKPMFRDVVALSFLGDCVLRLRKRKDRGWDRVSVPVAARSAYRLSGPVREDWEHSILPMDRLRYSVTFRTLRD
jgi:alkylated DNA repair dioxygenase AlkB